MDGTKKLDGTYRKGQTGFIQWPCRMRSKIVFQLESPMRRICYESITIQRLHFIVFLAFSFAESETERAFVMDKHLDMNSCGPVVRMESSIITHNHNLR